MATTLGAVGGAILALALVSTLGAISGCTATRADKALCLSAFTTSLRTASINCGMWQACGLSALWPAASAAAGVRPPS